MPAVLSNLTLMPPKLLSYSVVTSQASLMRTVVDTRPSTPDFYMQQYRPALIQRAPSLPFTVDYYDVVHEMVYPKHDDEYDCIMLTGSAASAYENVEWITKLTAYVSRIASSKPHIKIIGMPLSMCSFTQADLSSRYLFGHQIIARAMGGECVPNGGIWEVGPTRIQLTDLGKQIFGSLDTLTIQQMHRDHVPAVPPNFHLLASTDISPNQGTVLFYPEDSGKSKAHIHILTVQGHPEFTEPVVTSIIEQRAASGVINAQAVKDAEARRFVETNAGTIVGKAIWEVILDKI